MRCRTFGRVVVLRREAPEYPIVNLFTLVWRSGPSVLKLKKTAKEKEKLEAPESWVEERLMYVLKQWEYQR